MIYSSGSKIKIFACNSNRSLAEAIAKKVGLELGDAVVQKFNNRKGNIQLFRKLSCPAYAAQIRRNRHEVIQGITIFLDIVIRQQRIAHKIILLRMRSSAFMTVLPFLSFLTKNFM